DSSEISESVNFCVMEAIKLCRLDTPIIFIEARINRSEERRVGKECRYRWLAYHLKKRMYSMRAFAKQHMAMPDMITSAKTSADHEKLAPPYEQEDKAARANDEEHKKIADS